LEAWSRMDWKTEALRDGASTHLPGVLQALTSQLKSEAGSVPGQSATVYFYQPPQWHAFQVEKEPPSDEHHPKQKRDKGSTWKASVDWTGDFLGIAVASIRLVDGGVHLDLQQDGPHAYAILLEEIPRLESALAQQGLELRGWSYLHQSQSSATPETSKLPLPPITGQLDIRF
jgi:hypothetical protein